MPLSTIAQTCPFHWRRTYGAAYQSAKQVSTPGGSVEAERRYRRHTHTHTGKRPAITRARISNWAIRETKLVSSNAIETHTAHFNVPSATNEGSALKENTSHNAISMPAFESV